MFKKAAVSGLIVLCLITGGILNSAGAAKRSDVQISVTTARKMIVNQNIQQAKQKAVSQALNVALQNAYASLLSRQVFASNLDFFYDQIIPKTSDYIVTYKVLGGVENSGYYLVGVESKVDINLLKKTMTDARILSANADKPSIVLFIAEKMPDDVMPKYWWGKTALTYESLAEKIITQKLVENRMVIIGDDTDRPDPAFYNITFNSIYDVAAAKSLGREMKADMIVFGSASADEAINRMGEEKAFHSQINLEGYNLETGEKVIQSQIQAVATSDTADQGIVQALEKASLLSSQDLIEKIDVYWQKNLRKEHSFDLKIEGDSFLSRFIALKHRLKQMPGIENMQPKEVGSNSALMEVFYKGNSSKFADAVMLKTFDSFGLEIFDVTDTMVVIRFIEKGQPSLFEQDSRIESVPIEGDLKPLE